jgi:hypothetical protein
VAPLREDLAQRGEDVINSVQAKHLSELPDVFCAAEPGCERLRSQEVLRRGGKDAKARVVEYPSPRQA